MWFDGVRKPNTLYVASTSRGKDSTAMLRAIQLLGFPLDAIVSVDVWFDDDTPAELPPMTQFKEEYDKKVLEWFGVPVTRLCATKRTEEAESRISYTKLFYSTVRSAKYGEHIKGFPNTNHSWCKLLKDQTDGRYEFKKANYREIEKYDEEIKIVHYVGITADEKSRIERHINKPDMILPLVQIGWDEALCGLETKYMDMLSPTYSDGSLRDGCWFCHNQGLNQLRRLRKNYPELWAKLMKLDEDSPVTFKPDGRTVHDYDKRFALEDAGEIDTNDRFCWEMTKCRQMTIFDFIKGA